jgi:hypothetical protein
MTDSKILHEAGLVFCKVCGFTATAIFRHRARYCPRCKNWFFMHIEGDILWDITGDTDGNKAFWQDQERQIFA